jgi:hypothetical protein
MATENAARPVLLSIADSAFRAAAVDASARLTFRWTLPVTPVKRAR